MTHEASLRGLIRCWRHVLGLLLLISCSAYGRPIDSVANGFAQLGDGRLATRTVSLAELGVHDPIPLYAPDGRHELYLPVPANVPIRDASMQIDGTYLRKYGGRVTLTVSIDGTPVLARSPEQEQGGASANIGVDGAPRESGFVRVGLDVSPVLSNSMSIDPKANGSTWTIAPTSRLTYRYDPNAIVNLRNAWGALPGRPVVMLGSRQLAAQAFDAGWRSEALLQFGGRQPVTVALPAVGETVDLGTVDVPSSLLTIPAFAALAAGGSHKLADAAQVGALIALAPRAAFAPDVIIADDRLRATLNTDLDALRAEVASVAPDAGDAGDAFDAWRNRVIGPVATPLKAGEVRLAHLDGQPAIVVGDPVGVAALAQAWHRIDAPNQLVVHEIDNASDARSDAIALSLLGGAPRTLNVQGRGAWRASFDLGAASRAGKLPSDVVLDVAAAPTADNVAELASIYFNDVLIGTQMLRRDGKPQRVTAHVPHDALAPVNLLRVEFEQPPQAEAGDEAHSIVHPIEILPDSHLTLASAEIDDAFTGMVARFVSQANVIVPESYLLDAPHTLPRVASLANASFIVPTRADLSVVPPGATASPKRAFLALEVALTEQKGVARLSKDRLSLSGASGERLADVTQLNRAAVIEAVKSGDVSGLAYFPLGDAAAPLPLSLRLSRGDVAIVDGSGVLRELDTRHPGEGVDAVDAGMPWMMRGVWWRIPAGLTGLLILLLMMAHYARRRNRSQS